jgi:hypothetical protein
MQRALLLCCLRPWLFDPNYQQRQRGEGDRSRLGCVGVPGGGPTGPAFSKVLCVPAAVGRTMELSLNTAFHQPPAAFFFLPPRYLVG